MEFSNKKWSREEFLVQREQLFAQTNGSMSVDWEQSAAYLQEIPNAKWMAFRLWQAAEKGNTLIQSAGGVSKLKEEKQMLRTFEREGEADLLSVAVDSFTRQNRLEEAQKLIDSGRSREGFPVIGHGVEACRELTEGTKAPVELVGAGADPRLLAEVAAAGGFTSIEGGGIASNLAFAKNISLERSIADWQYADRMVGLYAEEGIILNRELYGPLTGTMVPPCVSHSISVLESLMAAEQGVKSITVGYAQCGNLVQDVAAIRSLKKLTEEYMAKFGYHDVQVTTAFHQWLGGFPQDEAKAFGVISLGSTAAALAGATKIRVRGLHEVMGQPEIGASAKGLRCTRQTVLMLSEQTMTAFDRLEEECRVIEAETRCILDRCIALGGGDPAAGAVRAVAAGMIDVPFAPSRLNAGKMLPIRDNDGCVRIFHPGGLPLSADLLDFNRSKVEERARAERRAPSFQMVIDDIYAISGGRLVGRPR